MLTEPGRADDLLARRRVAAQKRTKERSRRLAAVGFAGAVLAFTLPFGAVDGCDGQRVRFTGAELATFSVREDDTYAFDHTLHGEVERNGGALALATLVAAVIGLALTTVVARRGARACAIAALVALQLSAWTIALAGDSDGTTFLVGFWLTLGALLVALEALSFPARRSAGERGSTLVGRLLVHALSAVWPTIVLVWL